MYKISACVIVKNEEKNMPRWFQGVKDLADEYIVVDTGSSDKTKEIALANGAKVFDFKWINDFSAAKNYAIEQATGDWIVFLDADEYFHTKDKELLKQKIKFYHKIKKVDVLMCKLVNIDVDDHNRMMGSVFQSRVFRNRDYIRYKGKIHEALYNRKKSNTQIQYVEGITIYHTGYSRKLTEIKAKRNLEIILDRIEHDGIKAEDYIYLVDCYYGLKDYEKVIYYARKFHEEDCTLYGIAGKSYLYWVVSLSALGREWGEISYAIEAAKKRYPQLIWLSLLEGISLCQCKHYLKAEIKLKSAIKKCEKSVTDITDDLTVDYIPLLLPIAFFYLGNLMRMQDKDIEAMDYYVQCLQRNRYDVNCIGQIISMLGNIATADIIDILSKLYAEEDAEFLFDVVRYGKNRELKLYYWGKTKDRKLNTIDQLMLADNMNLIGEILLKESPVCQKKIIALMTKLGINPSDDRELVSFFPKEEIFIWDMLTGGEHELTNNQQDYKREIVEIINKM